MYTNVTFGTAKSVLFMDGSSIQDNPIKNGSTT